MKPKCISRELHDDIAQTLTGINLRLAALKAGAAVNANGFQNQIAITQQFNVARHARATRVELRIEKLADAVRLKIKDNGRAFSVRRTLLAKKNNRLGLLGMRERVEMVGGSFGVESAPGHGTTILAQIPWHARGATRKI